MNDTMGSEAVQEVFDFEELAKDKEQQTPALPAPSTPPLEKDPQVEKCVDVLNSVLEKYDCALDADILISRQGNVPLIRVVRRIKENATS